MKGAVLQIIFFVLVITGCQSPNPVPSSSPEVVQKEVRLELEQFSQLSGKSDLKGILVDLDIVAFSHGLYARRHCGLTSVASLPLLALPPEPARADAQV